MRPRILLPFTDPADLEFYVEIHLTGPNVALQRRFDYPDILTSGIRYRREPPGVEDWRCLDVLYDLGNGDCEDLAAAHAAQRRVWAEKRGIKDFSAHVIVTPVSPGLRHARVRESFRGTVRIVDPSKILGMGEEG